jgi:hypothetical protein
MRSARRGKKKPQALDLRLGLKSLNSIQPDAQVPGAKIKAPEIFAGKSAAIVHDLAKT